MRRQAALLVVMTLATATPAAAQRPSFFGTVARDTLEHMIGGAEIRIPALGRATATNYLGQFRFSGLPSGKYAVAIRSVGFQQVTDSIDIADGKFVERDYVLKEVPLNLDTVRTVARERKWVSPALNAFEERRRSGGGGYFIADSVFRANEGQKLPDILARIPGLTKVGAGASTFVASGRSIGNDGGPVFQSKRGPNVWCYVTLYVDGVRVYQASNTSAGSETSLQQPPDLARFPATEYAAAEYYPGGASVPPQFNVTGSSCGVLLLWTRER